MATLNNVITNANGCVGIGTSSPAQLLELKKTTGSAIALLNYNDSVKFNINASSAGAGYVGMVTNHDLIFVTNDTERARLNTNGNIGIGTSSPAYKLEVLGLVNVVSAPGSYGAMFRARDSVTLGTESFGGVHFTSNPGTDYTIGKWTTAAGAGLLQIRDQSGNKFFTIDGAGNVGIGTTTLSSLLTLHGTYPQLVANNPSTGSGVVIQLKDNGRDAGFMGHSTTTARLQFGSRGIANTQMTLDYNGNLGIGTTSPTRKLHIDGGATTTVGIYIDANGISGTDIEQSSDAFRFQIRDNIPALFYTNNTERIRIASDGNVGIGTSSPVSKLHLDDATAPYITITRTGVPTWQLRNNFPVNQYGFSFNNTTAGTTPLFIGAGGNIGIGTSGPTNRLDVVGGSGTTFNMSNDGDSQRGGKLTFISSSATGRQFYVGTTSAIYNLVFGIDSVEKARIDTAGNVGINTTSPSAKLHVSASASTTAGIFQGVVGIGLTPTSAVPRLQVYGTSTSNAESRLAIYTSNTGTAFNNGLQLAVASDSVTSLINYSNTALYFGTNSTERMRIASDGNVGIGTTSPTISGGGLQVYGSGQKGIRVSGNSSNSYSVEIGCDTTKMSYIQTVGSLDRGLNLYTGNASTVVMTLTGSSVGIGTTSPAAKLQILKTGDNGSNGLTDYGIVTVSSGYGTQATLGAEVIGDGYSNLNLGSNIGGVRTFWHISKRLSSASTPHSLEYFYYDGATFNQRFTFTPAGNLGIGTVVPTVKLAVSDGTTVAQVNPYSGVAYFGTVNNYPMALSVNSSEKVRINSDGNVGIGTTSPSSLLNVSGTGTLGSVFQEKITNGTTTLALGTNATAAEVQSQGSVPLYLNYGGNNVCIVPVGSGNVGIGTSSPTQKLDIVGSYAAAGDSSGILKIRGGATGTDTQLNFGVSADNGYGWIQATDVGLTNNINIILNPLGGNVGIGTTSPAYKLEVNGSLYATRLSGSAMFTTSGKGRFYGTASYALAAPAGSSLTGQTDSATPFETSLGYQAGNVNTGTGNTAIGYQALLNNTTGTGSIAIGYQALYTNTRGKRNIAIGYEALRTTQGSTDVYGDPIGDENVAIGYQAARAAFNINRVVAIGHRALAKNLAGGNVAIGWLAMESNVGTANSNSGVLNTAVGTMALSSNTSGNANSAFGYLALNSNTTGYENTAVGHRSMVYNTTGKNNCSFGSYALYYNQIANNNSAFGNFALYNNTAKNNSAFGYKALRFNTTGVNNCAFGSGSLYNNTSGTKNTTVGGNAGSTITTGTNLSVFGYNAQASTATATNEVTLGNSSVATLRCQVTTITALSDFRDKTDINNVEVGLSFVEKLRPVTFKWDKREWYTDGNRDGSKKDTITQIGFIAQELKALQESENATYLNLVYESNPDKLEATPGNLLIPLIKAVQELNAIVKQQRIEFDDKIAKQQLEIDYLKSKLNN